MSKKILAFGASNSSKSINKQFATFAIHQLPTVEKTILDLNDYEMPIYSIDREKTTGIPDLARQFKAQVLANDGLIISFAEHNGAYSTAFKNIFDWISRIEKDVWGNKPMLLLATSPGGRGGKTVLDIALNKFKFMNDNTMSHFSLPGFYDNFSSQEGIKNDELKKGFEAALGIFKGAVGI